MRRDGSDEVLDALEAASQGLGETIALLKLALERIVLIREQRLSGMTYSEIADHSDTVHIAEVYTTSLLALERDGHRLRVEGMRVLHAEGLSIDRIAELFGVSRQRVSALLRSRARRLVTVVMVVLKNRF